MKSLVRLIVAGSLLFVTNAQAGLLLEPYAGYAMTSAEMKPKAGTDAGVNLKYTNDGLGLGARLGYKLPAGLWFAGDYFMQMEGDIKRDPAPGSTGSVKGSISSFFIDLGFDVPTVPLRLWGGYAIVDDWKWAGEDGTITWFGPAYKFGIGFKVVPLLSINAEYIMHQHNKLKGDGTEVNISDAEEGYKAQTIFISVSVPFSPMGK